MKNRRKRYLIEKGIQLHFLRIFMATILAISLVLGFILYLTQIHFNTTLLLIAKDSSGISDKDALERMAPLREEINRSQLVSLFSIFGSILLYLIVIGIWSIYLSHRIAGPIYKITQAMKQTAQGNFQQRIILRKHDWLKDTAEAFNELMESLQKKGPK